MHFSIAVLQCGFYMVCESTAMEMKIACPKGSGATADFDRFFEPFDTIPDFIFMLNFRQTTNKRCIAKGFGGRPQSPRKLQNKLRMEKRAAREGGKKSDEVCDRKAPESRETDQLA
jgi:hypothetical protein